MGDWFLVFVYFVFGDNMMEVLRKGLMKVFRRFYFVYMNFVVFSEKLVKEEGFSFILDNFDCDIEFRMIVIVVIVYNCKVEDIIKVLMLIDKIFFNKVNKMFSFM